MKRGFKKFRGDCLDYFNGARLGGGKYPRKLTFNGCAAVAVMTVDSKFLVIENTACHAGLAHYNGYTRDVVGDTTPKIIMSGIQEYGTKGFSVTDDRVSVDDEYKDICYDYYDWLMGESPWAPSFITKSAKEAFELGFTMHDPREDANIMVSGCIAARYIWEWSSMIRGWHRLVQAGLDKGFAFLMSHCLCYYGSGSFTLDGHHFGHTAVYLNDVISAKCVVDFVDGKPFTRGKLGPYVDVLTYKGIPTLLKPDHNNVDRGVLFDYTKVIKEIQTSLNNTAKASESADNNPFAVSSNPVARGGRFESKAVANALSEYLYKLKKEVGSV